MSGNLYCLVSQTKLVSDAQLFEAARALELNCLHLAKAWGIKPAAVIALRKKQSAPIGAIVVVITDKDADKGALAVHYVDGTTGRPAGVVYAHRASGFNTGSFSVVEASSHEMLEIELNPFVNIWRWHPLQRRALDGVQVVLEVCDPTQRHYEIKVRSTAKRRDVAYRVSSFVKPPWFNLPAANDNDPKSYDHIGEFSGPGQVGFEGYVVLRKKNAAGIWERWFEDGSGNRLGSAPPRALAAVRSGREPDANAPDINEAA